MDVATRQGAEVIDLTDAGPNGVDRRSSYVDIGVDVERIGRWLGVARRVGRPAVRYFWRVRIEGLDRVPTDGPAILAPNHTSFIDSMFLSFLVPRPVHFVGKAEYLDDWKTRYLFPALGMIPVDRRGGSRAAAALDAAARVLDAGELFGIYPEGTRSRDGRLHKGHTGVARLALRTGAPIIPTGLIGTQLIQPCDAPMPRPFMPATIRFGRPVDPARFADTADDPLLRRRITDEVMFEIGALTGQVYSGRYATRRAETAPREVVAPTARALVGAGV